MSLPQYAVILTDENVDGIVANATSEGWTLPNLHRKMIQAARRGKVVILYTLLDKSGAFVAFNDVSVDPTNVVMMPRFTETATHGPFKTIEEI